MRGEDGDEMVQALKSLKKSDTDSVNMMKLDVHKFDEV